MLEILILFFIKTASANSLPLEIAEVYPNPEGSDEGAEFITVCNLGVVSINLGNYSIDDSQEGSDPFQMEGSIYPTECKTITDSESGITLNNSEDSVRILDKEGSVIFETTYANPEEDEIIYELVKDNDNAIPPKSIIITEIFANPETGEQEWIEIKNTSQSSISLNGLFLDESEENSIYKKLLPYIATAIIIAILSIYEYKKRGA